MSWEGMQCTHRLLRKVISNHLFFSFCYSLLHFMFSHHFLKYFIFKIFKISSDSPFFIIISNFVHFWFFVHSSCHFFDAHIIFSKKKSIECLHWSREFWKKLFLHWIIQKSFFYYHFFQQRSYLDWDNPITSIILDWKIQTDLTSEIQYTNADRNLDCY